MEGLLSEMTMLQLNDMGKKAFFFLYPKMKVGANNYGKLLLAKVQCKFYLY